MTSLPARSFRVQRARSDRARGRADLVSSTRDRVRDVATCGKPHAYAEGIPHVLVNGAFVVRDGKATGARPGQVLRREQEVIRRTRVRGFDVPGFKGSGFFGSGFYGRSGRQRSP